MGPGSISGIVVDQFGDPVSGLKVLAYPMGLAYNCVMAHRSTDATGRFEFDNMLLGDYMIKITDASTSLEGTSEGLSEWIDSVPVSLDASSPEVDTGTHLAVRSAQFHATGEIRGGPENHSKMTMRVIIPRGRKQLGRRVDLVVHPAIDETGVFNWTVPVGMGGEGRIEVEFLGTTKEWTFQLGRTTEQAPFLFTLDWE